jgi:hypothetical protein
MHAIAGAINIATPDALQTEQNIAAFARDLLERIGKSSGIPRSNPDDGPEIPFFRRPGRRREKRNAMSPGHDTGRQPFEVGFRSAARRKTAPDNSYGKLSSWHQREDMGTLLGDEGHNTC